MDYKIYMKRSNETVQNLLIDTHPKNEVLEAFFLQVRLKNFPELLSQVSISTGYWEEFTSVRFYAELDWEDLENLESIGGITEGAVRVYHQEYGYTVLNEKLFDEILYQYCVSLLEFYKDDKTISEFWFQKLKEGLEKLKIKIEKNN